MNRRALDYACPACGSAPNVECRETQAYTFKHATFSTMNFGMVPTLRDAPVLIARRQHIKRTELTNVSPSDTRDMT